MDISLSAALVVTISTPYCSINKARTGGEGTYTNMKIRIAMHGHNRRLRDNSRIVRDAGGWWDVGCVDVSCAAAL